MCLFQCIRQTNYLLEEWCLMGTTIILYRHQPQEPRITCIIPLNNSTHSYTHISTNLMHYLYESLVQYSLHGINFFQRQQFLKSVKVWWSYRRELGGWLCFKHSVYWTVKSPDQIDCRDNLIPNTFSSQLHVHCLRVMYKIKLK